VSLTLKGKKRLTPLLKKAAVHEKSVLSKLGEQQSHELKSILQKLFKAPN
jgi:DNA-binding MarR family transcriptional regulator